MVRRIPLYLLAAFGAYVLAGSILITWLMSDDDDELERAKLEWLKVKARGWES